MSKDKKLPTIDIKGKEYVQVKDRVLELHRQNDSFSLSTDIIYDDDQKVVMQTRLKIDNRMFTGIASENKNQDSPYENCETSSVGRCIGFYGIGIIESIESSDGMTKYHNNNNSNIIEQTITDDFEPFKHGKNKGVKIVDLSIGDLEWIIHESGMSEAKKRHAKKVLEEKYTNIEGEAHNNIVNKTIEQEVDTPDNETIPF